MTPDQIRIHLELQGWEAWVENPYGGLRYNLTHPQGVTVWVPIGLLTGKHTDYYRYGFDTPTAQESCNAERIGMQDVPDTELGIMWATIQEVRHGS